MGNSEGNLSPDQLRAIDAMSGADPAKLDGLNAEAVVDWVQSDAGFVARLNRARSYRAERIRADIRSPASDAVATLRELITAPEVPSAVRLRASLAILQAADAMNGTDQELSANFDREASAINSVSFLGLFPPKAQNRLLLCIVPPRSDAVRNLVPRFDRARRLTPGLRPWSFAV